MGDGFYGLVDLEVSSSSLEIPKNAGCFTSWKIHPDLNGFGGWPPEKMKNVRGDPFTTWGHRSDLFGLLRGPAEG